MLPLTPDNIAAYQRSRLSLARPVACLAPFGSLFFGASGEAIACCHNRTQLLGRYPEQSILEMWTGPAIQEMRAAMKAWVLPSGCAPCHSAIQAGDFATARSHGFDVELANEVDL